MQIEKLRKIDNNNWEIRLTIPGVVKGKKRPRIFYKKDFGKFGAATPKATREQERSIGMYALEWMSRNKLKITINPVFVEIEIYREPPDMWTNPKRKAAINGEFLPTVKPDIDNVAKLILDSLQGVAIVDDKQVVDLHIRKRYSEHSYTTITIKEI